MTQPKAWMTKDTGNGQYAMWGQKPTSDYYTEHPEKLIELCTLLEKAEKALDKYRGQVDRFGEHTSVEALAAIKQWKKKT